MRSSPSQIATAIVVGLLAAACTSAATPAPDVTPTASPSITITRAAASPTAAANLASPSLSPSPSATPQPTPEPTPVPVPPKPTAVTFDEETRPDRRRTVWGGHPDGHVGSAAERGRRDSGLRRDRVHSRAGRPSPGHQWAMPCRAHAPAGIGPEAARHGTGVRWRCQLDMDGGRRLRPQPIQICPRRAGIPRRRAGCLQRGGQLDFRHRRAWRMVASGSWRRRHSLLRPPALHHRDPLQRDIRPHCIPPYRANAPGGEPPPRAPLWAGLRPVRLHAHRAAGPVGDAPRPPEARAPGEGKQPMQREGLSVAVERHSRPVIAPSGGYGGPARRALRISRAA